MLIKNTTAGDLGLEPGVVIPAGQTVDVPDDIAKRCEASDVVKGWLKSGALAVEKPQAKAKAAPKTDDKSEAKAD